MKYTYFYIPDYPETPTGGILYHKIVYDYFRRKKDNVFVFGNNRYAKQIDKSKLLKFMSGLYYSLKIPSSSRIILSNTAFLHFLLPVMLNKLLRRHHYLMIVHHLVRNENPEFFRRTFEKLFVRLSDTVITISKASLDDLMKNNMISGKSVEIVRPGLNKIGPGKSHENKIPKLLFAGTIEKRKGLHVLVEALAKIPEMRFELIITGDTKKFPDYFDSIRSMVESNGLSDKIEFAGRVSDQKLIELYRSSDLFVFPSLWEGYGMVVAEAMSSGLPSISSGLPSVREIIDDGVNGIMFEPGNSDDLAEKLKMLLSDKGLLQKLSDNSLKKSESLPTWDETSERIMEISESKSL